MKKDLVLNELLKTIADSEFDPASLGLLGKTAEDSLSKFVDDLMIITDGIRHEWADTVRNSLENTIRSIKALSESRKKDAGRIIKSETLVSGLKETAKNYCDLYKKYEDHFDAEPKNKFELTVDEDGNEVNAETEEYHKWTGKAKIIKALVVKAEGVGLQYVKAVTDIYNGELDDATVLPPSIPLNLTDDEIENLYQLALQEHFNIYDPNLSNSIVPFIKEHVPEIREVKETETYGKSTDQTQSTTDTTVQNPSETNEDAETSSADGTTSNPGAVQQTEEQGSDAEDDEDEDEEEHFTVEDVDLNEIENNDNDLDLSEYEGKDEDEEDVFEHPDEPDPIIIYERVEPELVQSLRPNTFMEVVDKNGVEYKVTKLDDNNLEVVNKNTGEKTHTTPGDLIVDPKEFSVGVEFEEIDV